jgi:hypothetical protein
MNVKKPLITLFLNCSTLLTAYQSGLAGFRDQHIFLTNLTLDVFKNCLCPESLYSWEFNVLYNGAISTIPTKEDILLSDFDQVSSFIQNAPGKKHITFTIWLLF